MSDTSIACGLYKTTLPLGELPAGRLVYFHNHGDPGPGIYLPKSWAQNTVEWHERGTPVPNAAWAVSLQPLPPEGLYAVSSPFYCCEKQCTRFEQSQLVQLGYTMNADLLLFVPEWTKHGLGIPERGTKIDANRASLLQLLNVARGPEAPPKSTVVH